MNEHNISGNGQMGEESVIRQRSASSETGVLEEVGTTETIADRVDFERIQSQLPEEWTVKPDLVQSGTDPLAETLLFRRSLAEPQLVLRPADPSIPEENIEFYERSGPQTVSKRTMTVDRLTEAVRVAVNRIHQLDG
ncbi:MAG: hypothetical protein V5A36_02775 [Natronomonas sp.]